MENQCHHSNIIKTSVPQSSLIPHHTSIKPHLQEIITSLDYTIYKLIKLLQSFNMDRFHLVSLFKQMCPTEQIQTV